MKRDVAPDHGLVIEIPGRAGKDTATGACVGKDWSRTIGLPMLGVPDEAAARSYLEAAYAADHAPHLARIRREAAAFEERWALVQEERDAAPARARHETEVTLS